MSDTGSPTDDPTTDPTVEPTPDEERPVGADEGDRPLPGRLTADPEADDADAQEQARDVPLDDEDR